MEELAQRSPDSSMPENVSTVGIICPQCPSVFTDESLLTGHLLTNHRVRLVVANEVPQVLNSTASSVSTSPLLEDSPNASRASTNCPVCRQQVEDLSHHFAVAHSAPQSEIKTEQPADGASMAAAILLPNQPLPASHLTADDLQQKLLTLKQENIQVSNFHNSILGAKRKSRKPKHEQQIDDESESEAINLSVKDQDNNNSYAAFMEDRKRRRKQTSVPDANKDQRYWARRLKNNEAAKRSRDMRIQREKVIFDENARLEASNNSLQLERDRLKTDNKELKLKMDFILEENERLKGIIHSLESQNSAAEPNGAV